MNVWGGAVHAPTLDRAVAAWLLKAGMMGRAERRFFQSVIESGHVVVDVGANQGVFTLLFSRLVGDSGRVVALEPDPSLFAALDQNCRVNVAHNVTRLNVAAGDTPGQGILHCSRFNRGDNRMTDSLRGPAVPVEIVTLDDVVPESRVDMIKIDVQGFELNVVRGMQAILDRSPAIRVLFEFWPTGLRHAGSPPGALLDFFTTRGFALFVLSGSKPRQLDLQDVRRLSQRGAWFWSNVLAVRE